MRGARSRGERGGAGPPAPGRGPGVGPGIVLGLLLTLPTACLSPPTPEAVLATGFGSPEQAFHTFQTALRGDLFDLEYRTLSSEFKARHGVRGRTVYEEARERVLQEEPLLRHVARAEITGREDLATGRVRLTARVDALFTSRSFLVTLVREDAYLVDDETGPLEGDALSWDEAALEEDGQLVLRVPMPEGVRPGEVTRLTAAREWKIASFDALASP